MSHIDTKVVMHPSGLPSLEVSRSAEPYGHSVLSNSVVIARTPELPSVAATINNQSQSLHLNSKQQEELEKMVELSDKRKLENNTIWGGLSRTYTGMNEKLAVSKLPENIKCP